MDSQIVWQSTVDSRYEVVVVWVAPYQGLLTITDSAETLFSRQVGLMYNAQFGPDVSDVHDWKQIAIDFIDNQQP
jgi:hypothetical protein